MAEQAKKDYTTWRGVKKIFQFAWHEWPLIAFALAVMGVFAGLEGAYGWLIKPLADVLQALRHGRLATDMDTQRMATLGWLALGLAPLLGLAAFGQSYLQGRVTWKLTVTLRNKICRAVLPQSLSFFEGRRSGDLMSRITNDVTSARKTFMLVFGDLPQQILQFLTGLGIAIYFNWQLLVLGAVVGPVLVVPLTYLAKRIRRYGKAGLERLSDLTDQMAQMFSGIRVIKAFKMEDAEVQEFERVNEQLQRKMFKLSAARGMSAGTVQFVGRMVLAVAILVAAWFFASANSGRAADLGRIGSCAFGMYMAFDALKALAKQFTDLQEAIPAMERIFELVDHVPSLQDAPNAVTLTRIEKGVTFRNVTFGYNDETVLRDISFEVKKGQTVAIVGRSGAGKSTVIALLCRFYDVTEGAVEIDGLDVRQITRDSLLDQISIVTQQTFLFNRSIAENIRYGRRSATMEEVQEAARAANIHDFIMTLPEGYDSLCGEFGTKLSGGQRQRIAIARAILKQAEILILDEAMVGLDAESESLVRDALIRLMAGRTTFVVTHDLLTIKNANRILVLRDGELAGNGAHDELLAQEGEYRSLCMLQFATLGSAPPARPPRPMSQY